MAAVAGARLCLLAVGLLAGLVLLAGLCQLVCGLYLLLKVPQPALSGASIAAGLWGVLVGLLAAMLCFAGPLRASRWSQLQLAVFCSAPAMNAALGVLIGLAPGTEPAADVNTVRLLLSVSTAAAATLSFLAANVVFCMQLTFVQYQPGTHAWKSPVFVSSDATGFLFSQGEMTQKPSAPDLWLPGAAVPLASWVYRTQSSVETARCDTALDAPPSRPNRRPSSLALTAPAAALPSNGESPSPAVQLPRCLSLLSVIYGSPAHRLPRSCSLLGVRPPLAEASPAAFPAAPAPLCASPLPTPVAERPPPGTPLAGTISRLASVLSRLHSDPDYRASRELQEAIEALEALQVTPAAAGRRRPTSAVSREASSGYGSPEQQEQQPERRSGGQLVGPLEGGRSDTPLRRPTVPPPPPPPPGDRARPAHKAGTAADGGPASPAGQSEC